MNSRDRSPVEKLTVTLWSLALVMATEASDPRSGNQAMPFSCEERKSLGVDALDSKEILFSGQKTPSWHRIWAGWPSYSSLILPDSNFLTSLISSSNLNALPPG